MSGVSVLILTLNEAVNIGECIDSCAFSDDIVVFDSMSTDETRAIAKQKGARVQERCFDNYAGQRNAALTTVQYRNDWVLMVDADERVPEDLAREVLSRVATADAATVMFRMRRKDFFLGQWLKRSSGYPTWFGRLMKIGRVHVQRDVNEEYIANGAVETLASHLHHFPFNRGISYWFERHNRYSSMEAISKVTAQAEPLTSRGVFSGDPIARRRVLKSWLYRMPMRPMIVFIYLYVFRLGMLDGRAGYYFSRMRASYEFFIDMKVVEIERRRRDLAV